MKLLDRLINWSLVALFFLVPLFFTSANFELFEFNKMLLVYTFASFNLCLWLLKKHISGNWQIDTSPFDIFALIFLASQAVSFVFSIDRHTSFFGYYSRFNGGLLSIIAYLILYKVIVDQKSIRLVKQLIITSLIAGTLVALYAIFEHFGHSFSCLMFTGKFDVACWVQDVQNRVYATLGQPNWLAAYLIVLIPITWGLTLNSKLKSQSAKPNSKIKIIYYLLFAVFYSCLLFTKSRSGFLGFAVSFAVFWPLALFVLKKHILKPFLAFSLSLFLLTFIIGSPFSQFDKYLSWNGLKTMVTPINQPLNQLPNQPPPTTVSQGPQLEVGGTESGEIRKIVWQGAIAIFKHNPIVGTGPETFAYSYYQFRPMTHNLVSEWDFLYNKAHNEYLNYLATTGGVGLAAYLLFCGAFIFYVVKNTKLKSQITNQIQNTNIEIQNNTIIATALGCDFMGIMVSNFFGFSVVISNLYLFTIPAMVAILLTPPPTNNPASPAGRKSLITNHRLNPFVLLVILSAFLVSIWQISNLWRADYYYNRGDKLTKQQTFLPAYEAFNQAILLNPSEPLFQSDLAFAAANLAVLTNASQDATTTGQLIQITNAFADKAYQASPFNINLLKTRIKTLYALSLIDPSFTDKTIATIQEAITKSPTDPKLVYNLGLMYGKTGNVSLAIETIKTAIQMKPNYIDARNALAQYYETLKMYREAIDQLDYIAKYISPTNQVIRDKIEELKRQLN